jgi:hypothetical protein
MPVTLYTELPLETFDRLSRLVEGSPGKSADEIVEKALLAMIEQFESARAEVVPNA